ncbi:hypothetical protein B0H19DRAFT_1271324 [Mycena capillaripes]|nr:hypothetical protein B0H19DRAFT_1271324 [Mycena capillaripes]
MDPAPSSEPSDQAQYPLMDYNGAPSSQPLQHGYPTPGEQYQSQPRPLPLPPDHAAQYLSYPAPAAPQPHLPMALSTQQYFSIIPTIPIIIPIIPVIGPLQPRPNSYNPLCAPNTHKAFMEVYMGVQPRHPGNISRW